MLQNVLFIWKLTTTKHTDLNPGGRIFPKKLLPAFLMQWIFFIEAQSNSKHTVHLEILFKDTWHICWLHFMSCTPVAALSIAYIAVSSQPLPMKNKAPKKKQWIHLQHLDAYNFIQLRSFGFVWGMHKCKRVTLKKEETDSGLFLSILSFVRGKDCSLYDVMFGWHELWSLVLIWH